MKISTKGRYALRAMLDLAANDAGEYIPLKDIAVRQNITIKYMEQIIAMLNKAGYLKSTRGSSGGYRLAKPPRQYTVGDILRVTEGTLSVVPCLDNGSVDCPRSKQCSTLLFWEEFNKVINNYADSVTLQNLLDENLKTGGDNYSI